MMSNFGPTAFLLFAATVPVAAQVVIRAGDIPREPGGVMVFRVAEGGVDGVEVNLGEPGRGRRWDLTGYQFTSETTDTLLDPRNAPGIEYFPEANRVLRTAEGVLGGGGDQYELVADSGWYVLGAAGSALLGFPVVFPRPFLLLPLPAAYGLDWENAGRYEFGFPAPDTLAGGVLDSVYLRLTLGGRSELDGDGEVIFDSGVRAAVRRTAVVEGSLDVVGVYYLFGRRFEMELPFGYDLPMTRTVSWLSTELGEIAAITSLPGEPEENFTRAAQVKVRVWGPEQAPQPAIRPSGFAVDWFSPNPFNRRTRLRFFVAQPGPVRIRVIDGAGRMLHGSEYYYSSYGGEVFLDAGSLPTGVYWVTLESSGEVVVRPVALIR